MDFEHGLLKSWIPSKISIQESKYLKRKSICNKCIGTCVAFGCFNQYKLESDINFDVYYLLTRLREFNPYHYDSCRHELFGKFNCSTDSQLTDVAYKIGFDKILNLCTYHAVWNHYFFHSFCKNDKVTVWMEEWDSMSQPKHVDAKNQLHYLVYLLLMSPERKSLMQEIRDFTLCPPLRKNGIYGYEYSLTKSNFENRISKI
jgi:hypothetical protein